MYRVSDARQAREEKIRAFLNPEPALALLLATSHFEWVVKRATLKLSPRPSKALRCDLGAVYGLDRYKKIWRSEVQPRLKRSLCECVSNWSTVRDAFVLRGALVHGAGGTSARHARQYVEAVISGAAQVEEAARKAGVNLYCRLRARKRPRRAR